MPEQEAFGIWLKHQRRMREITQQELARRAGCAVITLRKLESGNLRPSQPMMNRLIGALALFDADQAVASPTTLQTSLPQHYHLPTAFSILLGREATAAAACALLRGATRLLTFTGPGGIGKTRLATEIATILQDDFAGGCAFVDLAPIYDPALVLPTIAQTLRIQERPHLPLLDTIARELRDQQLLLVLDNFEQVIPSAPSIAALLNAIPGLRILVTSQVILHLSSEHIFTVAPLGLPSPNHETLSSGASATSASEAQMVEWLSAYPAIALFVERARAAAPRFTLTDANAATVAKICRHLDGLPLAIELAAARCRLFSPATLLTRLEQRMVLLTHGAKDLPARQQTLRAAIDWSYQLLNEHEQLLFRRLAVFTGGCALEAADSICSDQPEAWQGQAGPMPGAPPERLSKLSLIEQMSALLDHSLLYQQEATDGELRFVMLETIREYALEQLATSGELAERRARHSAYYLRFAEAAEPQLEGAEQAIWLRRLDTEHANLRSALSWSLTPEGDVMLGLQMVGVLWSFWWTRYYWAQGHNWLTTFLAVAPPTPSLARAQALHGAGFLTRYLGNQAHAETLLAESLALYRTFEDQRGIAFTLIHLAAISADKSNYEQVRAYCKEGLEIARAAYETTISAWALQYLGQAARWELDYAEAQRLQEQSLALFRDLGGQLGTAYALYNLACLAYEQHVYARSTALAEESQAAFRELGDTYGVSLTLHILAEVALAQNNTASAFSLCEESMALLRHVDDKRQISQVHLTLGKLAELRGQPTEAQSNYDASRHLSGQVGDQAGLTQALFRLSSLAILDDSQAARHLLEVSVTLLEDLGRRRHAALGACLRDAALAPLNWSRARALLERNLAQSRAAKDRWGECFALWVLGSTLLGKADAQALECLGTGLALAQALEDQESIFVQIIGIATLALHNNQISAAAQLCGALDTIQAALGVGYITLQIWPPVRVQYTRTREAVQASLADTTLGKAWAAGRAWSTSQAIAAALKTVAELRSIIAQSSPITIAEAAPGSAALPQLEKRMHQRAAELEAANQQLEAFAYSVSHDLRAPLRAIDGYTSILVEDYKESLDSEGQRVCAIIRRETGRMGELIDDLLAFARLCHMPVRTEPIDMTQLARQVFADVTQTEDQARLAFELSPLPAALGDMSLLRQVWVNLLSNAVKYSSKRTQAIIRIHGSQVDDTLIYYVHDNGAGFDMKYAEKLFGVFQRLHSDKEFPGTGVGLAIVQRIIERHGGRIWAEGLLNRGATFAFSLPKQRAALV